MVRLLRCLVLPLVGLVALSGCASTGGPPRSTCALIGGLIGAVGGVVVANNETEDETDENLAAGAIGATAGGILGYLICGEGTPPQPPSVTASASPARGEPPLRVQFTSQATDADGKVVSYAWDFGDGGRGEGATTSHTYEREGRYAARVVATDDDGKTGSATATVDVAKAEAAVEPPKTQRRIVLQGVTFAFNSAAISESDAPILDVAAESLKENPDVRVRVVGHTDSVGGDDYNQKLSERRAASVVEYLSRNGIDRTRLDSSGAGEAQPVASNETADGRAQNRRVELQIKE